MKFTFSYLLIASFAIFSSIIYATENPHEKDQQAKAAFRNLHFFSGGHGMHMAPNMIEVYFKNKGRNKGFLPLVSVAENIAQNRWGFQTTSNGIEGLYSVDYKDMKVGVLGCVACHGGKAAGRYYVGLGNKNIDVLRIAKDTQKIQKIWKVIGRAKNDKSDDYLAVEQSAAKMAKYLSDEHLGNLTQGLVPVSYIRAWFYRNEDLPTDRITTKGQVKVPALWGYGLKRFAGQFCDGYGDGEEIGWAVAVELASGQSVDNVRAYKEKVEKAEELFNDFLPPPYPFEVDHEKAAQGKKLFDRTCANCHGTYEKDENGIPLFKEPKFISWQIVRTDRDRLDGNTSEFNQLVENNPLSDLIKYHRRPAGYFAPRLEGIWARFPYLHNGSVATIKDLLSPASERPVVFSLKNAGEAERFDQENLGLTRPERGTSKERSLMRKAKRGRRNIYDTARLGHGNQGHEFFTHLGDQQKNLLIEYLKTL